MKRRLTEHIAWISIAMGAATWGVPSQGTGAPVPDVHREYQASHRADGSHGIVASGHPLATNTGLEVMESMGGNAVDAVVAVGLMLGVVDGFNSGIGGGCFILIRKPDGTLTAIDGRETAPDAATRDMFVRNGTAVPELSRTGPLAVGVPGALAAYAKAVDEHGNLSLRELARPAAQVARKGFVVHDLYARRLASEEKNLRRFEGSRAVFFKDSGELLKQGENLRQADLATTLEDVVREGVEAFYRGPTARRIAAWMAKNGGLLTVDDFSNYQAKVRQPVESTYRGFRIAGFPPPSSGGTHVAEILNILENFDLAGMNAVDRTHVTIEAMKLAFADRAHWLGDSDFAPVPRGLIDKGYAKGLSKRIFLNVAGQVAGPGVPRAPRPICSVENRCTNIRYISAPRIGRAPGRPAQRRSTPPSVPR